MTTAISSSDQHHFSSLYRSVLKNRLPFAIASAVLSLLMLLVYSVLSLQTQLSWMAGLPRETQEKQLAQLFSQGVHTNMEMFCLFTAALGILAFCTALVSNGYLHHKPSTDFYHSLPVTRTQLLWANTAAALTAVLVPYIVVFGLTVALQQALYSQYGCFGASYAACTLLDFTGTLIYVFVVFAFTTFISVQVGTITDALTITGALGIAPLLVYGIVGNIWCKLTYGATLSKGIMVMLSPFTFPLQRIRYVTNIRWGNIESPMLLIKGQLIWLGLGILFVFAAVVLYRRRKNELAGQAQPNGILQTTVKCGASFCGAMFFYAVMPQWALPVKLLGMLVGAAIIGVLVELVYSRGARLIVRHSKWFACGGALAVVVLFALITDIAGYEKRLPKAESIASVQLSYTGRSADIAADYMAYDYYQVLGFLEVAADAYERQLTSRDSIDIVLNMHKQAVENPPPKDEQYEGLETRINYPYTNLKLVYTMDNGKQMARSYDQLYMEAMMQLANLENKEDFLAQHHPLLWVDQLGVDQATMIREIRISDTYQSGGGTAVELQDADLRRLLEAMKTDMLHESLAEIFFPSSPALGYVHLEYKTYRDLRYTTEYRSEQTNAFLHRINDGQKGVLITPEYTNTIALLKELHLEQHLAPSRPDKLYLVSRYDLGIGDTYRVNTAYQSDTRSFYGQGFLQEYKSGNIQGISSFDELPVEVVVVTGEDILGVDAAARNQMLLGEDSDFTVALAIAEFDDEIYGYKFIPVDSIPEPYRNEMKSYLERQREIIYDMYVY